MKIFKWPIIYFVSIILLVISLFSLELTYILRYEMIIFSFIFISLLFIDYKKLKIKEKKLNNISYLIILGITLSIFYNTIIFNINKMAPFTNLYDSNNHLIITIISGILGSIIEELMFRGIIYNQLKRKYKVITSLLITTVIFSLLHFNLVQIIYGLIIGFLLIYVYELYKNIKAPIILHMTSNIISSLYTLFYIKNYFLILVSIIILIIIQKKIKYDIINNS